MGSISVKEYFTKITNWVKKPKVTNSTAVDTFYVAERSDTDVKIGFGVGSGGSRNGLWSYGNSRWLIFGDGDKTRLGHTDQSLSSIYIGKYSVLDLVYPVGSIYMSTVSTDPGTLFGGTWVQIPVSRTLVSAGSSSQTSVYLVNEKGGATTTSYTPAGTNAGTAISVDQMPSHGHKTLYENSGGGYSGGFKYVSGTNTGGLSGSTSLTSSYVNPTGGGKTHTHTFTGTKANIDIMQPWYAVYMWRRTE